MVSAWTCLTWLAKGWAAQHAAQRLSVAGPALVDAGGDIAVLPADADDEPFVVGIADPRQSDGLLTSITLSTGGVATSGRDYRRWHVEGAPYHHILDPRTAAPANTDVLTATVIASDALRAEAAAKAALILGSTDGLARDRQCTDLGASRIYAGRRQRVNPVFYRVLMRAAK
ncbi:MAG: FAD:protein FMN transferase [Anaerolineae bacterium]